MSAVGASESTPTSLKALRRQCPLKFLTDFAGSVLDAETGELLKHRHLIKRSKRKNAWGYSFGNEIGRLTQGIPGRVEGTNTIFFIHRDDVPTDRWKDVTHAQIVCNAGPQKEETNRTRLTFGGSNYNSDTHCGTPTSDLLTVKRLLNSVVSTPGAKFMVIDSKNFYLNTPMDRHKFLRMKLENFTEDVINQ